MCAGPEQTKPLSTSRERSTIGKTPDVTPDHQTGEDDHWVYPSPQMFYNAMKRKGWRPQEDDMEAIVRIHNTVNEKTWREVLRWEALHKRQ